jgi:hypothetical protein
VGEHTLTIGQLAAATRIDERYQIARLHHHGGCSLAVGVGWIEGTSDLGHV